MARLVSGVSYLDRTISTKTSVRSHPSSGTPDEDTETELDLRLDDWAKVELKSVAADFYHALFLFRKGKALKIVLTNKEGEGFEAWRTSVNEYEPTSKASVVGKLAKIFFFCARRFEGDPLPRAARQPVTRELVVSLLEWPRAA